MVVLGREIVANGDSFMLGKSLDSLGKLNASIWHIRMNFSRSYIWFPGHMFPLLHNSEIFLRILNLVISLGLKFIPHLNPSGSVLSFINPNIPIPTWKVNSS